jgi:hypothetical protein
MAATAQLKALTLSQSAFFVTKFVPADASKDIPNRSIAVANLTVFSAPPAARPSSAANQIAAISARTPDPRPIHESVVDEVSIIILGNFCAA